MLDPKAWTIDHAYQLAQRENIELTTEHLEVLHLARQFYRVFDLAPNMRPLVKYVKQNLGPDKGRSIYLMRLFTENPAKIVSKLAGLPKPDGCL